MEFLITEKQLQIILSESKDSQFTDSLKVMYSFVVNMLKQVKKSYDLNLRMFLTWGTSVGGFLLPLDNFIKNGNFDLTNEQRMLILCGVGFILLFEGKRGVTKILQKIKEEGIEDEFNEVLSKASKLKESFEIFMNSVISSVGTTLEVISYSFLIPIITDIFELANKSSSLEETATLIAERLVASGLVLISKEVLTTIVKKLLEILK